MTFSIVARDPATGAVGMQSSLADPEYLPKVASALASELVAAVRTAVSPPPPGPAGELTAWSPPSVAPGTTRQEMGGDVG